jgi:hypothetical protein
VHTSTVAQGAVAIKQHSIELVRFDNFDQEIATLLMASVPLRWESLLPLTAFFPLVACFLSPFLPNRDNAKE